VNCQHWILIARLRIEVKRRVLGILEKSRLLKDREVFATHSGRVRGSQMHWTWAISRTAVEKKFLSFIVSAFGRGGPMP
jgi:hypothetical protein